MDHISKVLQKVYGARFEKREHKQLKPDLFFALLWTSRCAVYHNTHWNLIKKAGGDMKNP
jgi:hypothetical protein